MAKKSKKDSSNVETQDVQDMILGEEEESSVAAFTKKRSFLNSELKQIVKVELPESLALPLEEGIAVLEERGLKKTASDFLKFCLEGVTEAQITQWVEQQTPLEWRVNQCLKDAEKAKLVRRLFDLDSSKSPQILKALEQVFEKKEKGSRALPKKKKKVVVAPQAEASADVALQ